MNDRRTEAGTEIAEGLPPVYRDRAGPKEPNVRVDEPTAMQVFFAWEKLHIFHNVIFFLWLAIKVSKFRGGFHDNPLREFLFGLLAAITCVATGNLIVVRREM